MDLMEYQGKAYFARYGVPVLPGDTADNVDEAVAAAERIGYPVVIKAQIQAGGRGKAGLIQLASNADEVRAKIEANQIFGRVHKGLTVHRVLVTRAMDIAERAQPVGDNKTEEYYASFTLDRAKRMYLGMLSGLGGVEIEEVAKTNPEAIATIHIDPVVGLDEGVVRAWVSNAQGINPAAEDGVVNTLLALYRCYSEGDCSLAEINPLILGTDGNVYALDAKVSLDDAAHHRHPEWDEFEQPEIVDERERLAKELDLQYVGLEGTVGIMANGAGLAMSTVDIVTQVGGSPANFLDIGGGASADVVANALRVINSDDNVKAIFINVFGGITRGEEVAKGIVEGMSRVELRAPVVVRLDGTNAEEGRAILDQHTGPNLIRANTMLEAAQKAVALADGRKDA